MKFNKNKIVIVGSGLAALATAARLCELGERDIAIYAKEYGATPYVAAINFVLPDNKYGDTPEQYYLDMMTAGYGINNKKLVEEIAFNTFRGYELLKRWDVEFAKNEDGSIKLRHLSGHTFPRSLCCTSELIGVQIIDRMVDKLKKRGVKFYLGCECVKLITDEERVYGITIKEKNGQLYNVYSPVVVAAWGGIGNLFAKSTYPSDIKGNTLAIAWEAGAKMVDLEFLEYEPMVVLYPEGAAGEPCPTAMLGEGAYLINTEGERFLLKVRPQGEAGAPKTLINREIWKQVNSGKGTAHGGVFVDLRHIPTEVLKSYPWFYNRMIKNGVDPNKELIEVGPMAHSFSGGIFVNENFESTIKGLFAVGEACGGVHGACRCAGNAASVAVLSGLLCAESIVNKNYSDVLNEFPIEYYENKKVSETYIPMVKELAAKVLGPYRKGEDLQEANEILTELLNNKEVKEDTETYQTIISIMLMIRAALYREESRGTHFRIDYPFERDEFKIQILL